MKTPTASLQDSTPGFLVGGGEMGQRIREYNWSKTSIGPIETWPKSLQTCIRIMLTSRQPIWIGWGKELIKFYNDPYKAIVGGKHPWALGKPASVVWKDIWRDIEPLLRKVMENDEGTYVEEQLLIMERNGYPEETYYTFSYTPITGDDGGTSGMICANTDDTDRILSQRQLQTLTKLGRVLGDSKTSEQVFERTIETLRENSNDFPFSIFYKVSGNLAKAVKTTMQASELSVVPKILNLKDGSETSELISKVVGLRKPHVIHQIQQRFGKMPRGPWDKHPDSAIVLPIGSMVLTDSISFLIIGLNPFRLLDEKYQSFFDLIADQVTTSLSSVHAFQVEKQRLDAMAEIDRAKTIFFSNISHEFRTPLTLLLGPLEDAMNEPNAVETNLVRMDVAFRNALRMQKLVNMLLDFSRIEAGRMDADFQAIDITEFTEGLTSTFRSAIEKAGMQLILDFKDIQTPVYVDPEMWEKIVFNLISNAFKYTIRGSITVSLETRRDIIQFSVTDTGSGIPENELEKIFERFHRAQNVSGRSQEGSGIGLAMVKELVKLHKGTIQVKSKVGQGSTFIVSIPLAQERKNAGKILSNESPYSFSQKSRIYIEDALQWSSQHASQETRFDIPRTENHPEKLYTVLVADDNTDMRNHIERLLSSQYKIVTVSNGEDAYQKTLHHKPDLIISDIMMPVLDGFGFLKKVRRNSELRSIPVIFLSARAGEESVVEGLNAGADDYLVKPFSSKELLAKINSQIKISKSRINSEIHLRRLFNQAPVAIAILKGKDFIVELANTYYLAIVERDHNFIGKPLFESIPELGGQGIDELLTGVLESGKSHVGEEVPINMQRKGKIEKIYFNFVYHPLFEDDGSVSGVFVVATDVTDLVIARENARKNALELEKKVTERTHELQRQKDFAETIMESSVDLMFVFGADLRVLMLNKKVEDFYGFKKEDVVGKSMGELFPNLPASALKDIEKSLDGEVVHNAQYYSEITRKYYESYLIPLKTNEGNVYAILSTAHDITGIIEASKQIKTTADQLRIANESLVSKNKELEQFAYISSHDLQEPLRKIQTFSELVISNLKDEHYVRKYLEKIDSAAARMSALIKDMLTYSKVASSENSSETVDLNQVLENVKNDFELFIDQKKAFITSNGLTTLKANKLQIHQLFSNLIGNSLKFSEANPIIEIRQDAMSGNELPSNATIDRGRKYVRLIFKDNGIGFEEQYSEQIFGMFQRLQNRKDFSGTGIGLALCKKIVENHNGSITASSVKGRGAVFTVYLPFK